MQHYKLGFCSGDRNEMNCGMIEINRVPKEVIKDVMREEPALTYVSML